MNAVQQLEALNQLCRVSSNKINFMKNVKALNREEIRADKPNKYGAKSILNGTFKKVNKDDFLIIDIDGIHTQTGNPEPLNIYYEKIRIIKNEKYILNIYLNNNEFYNFDFFIINDNYEHENSKY